MGIFIMYRYEINYKTNNSIGLSPTLKTISSLKTRYFEVLSWAKNIDYTDINEIVVFKGRKIHGFYDRDFKLDKSKDVYFHNAFYGLGQ